MADNASIRRGSRPARVAGGALAGMWALLLAAWALSLFVFIERYERRRTTHVRFVTLAAGALRVTLCTEGSGAGECPPIWFAHARRGPRWDLIWRPYAEKSFWPGDAAYVSVTVPLWMILAPGGLALGWWGPRTLLLRRVRGVEPCGACGYERAGLPPGAPCPECGIARGGRVAGVEGPDHAGASSRITRSA